MTEPVPEAADLAAETLGRQLLESLVKELEAAPGGWTNLSEHDQHASLERLRKVVRDLIDSTIRVLLGEEFPACPATLDNVSITGSIKARLTVAKGASSRHELLDAVGTNVIVLIGDSEQFLKGLEERRARSQQMSLLPPDPPSGGPNLELESDLPEDEPEPKEDEKLEENEADWVQVGNDPWQEQNLVTGQRRRSARGLCEDLLERVTSWNADPKHSTIRFSRETVAAASRRELLMALVWLDAYIAGNGAPEGVEQPPFLLPENPAP